PDSRLGILAVRMFALGSDIFTVDPPEGGAPGAAAAGDTVISLSGATPARLAISSLIGELVMRLARSWARADSVPMSAPVLPPRSTTCERGVSTRAVSARR